MNLRAIEPWRGDDLEVTLQSGDPRHLDLDNELAAWHGLTSGIGKRAPSPEEQGLEHTRGGGGRHKRHYGSGDSGRRSGIMSATCRTLDINHGAATRFGHGKSRLRWIG
jgi:hypothetical protein